MDYTVSGRIQKQELSAVNRGHKACEMLPLSLNLSHQTYRRTISSNYQYSLNCAYLALSKTNLGFECSWEVSGWTLCSFGGWPLSFARVADLKRPLMGTVQERQGVIPLPAGRPSQAIVDVSENMRAKLYSMFCKLGESLQLVWRCRLWFDLKCLAFFFYFLTRYSLQGLTQFLVCQLWIMSRLL